MLRLKQGIHPTSEYGYDTDDTQIEANVEVLLSECMEELGCSSAYPQPYFLGYMIPRKPTPPLLCRLLGRSKEDAELYHQEGH